MVKRHLKRIAMPKTWPVKRKGITFITRPRPGAHKLSDGMPLNVILKKILDIKTNKEVKGIMNSKDVLIDGITKEDHRSMVGLFDVISFPKIKKNYRIILNQNAKICAIEIPDKEAGLKPCKILNKTILKGNKVQLNLSSGRNIILKKNDYKTGDTILISLPKQEIKDHISFEKNHYITLLGGKYAGEMGNVTEIKGNKIKLVTKDGKDIETLKKYGFIIGKQNPLVKINE